MLLTNISIKGISNQGFILPDGYTWKVDFQYGKKEGKATVWNDKQLVSAVLYYSNDKLNGLCSFYENGLLFSTFTFVDDVKQGWSCKYENGKEVRWFLYKNGKKYSELIKCEEIEGFWKEIDVASKSLISICKYDENHQKNGFCFCYDGKTIKSVVIFENGKEKEKVKEFNGKKMIEYDDSSNIVYEGDYEDSIQNEYPRDGEGEEKFYDQCIYSGHWKKNKKEGHGCSFVSGFRYYDGEWKDNLPDGEGILYENNQVKYSGKWEKGIYKVDENESFKYRTGQHNKKRIIEKPGINRIHISMTVKLVQVSIKTSDELLCLLNDKQKKESVSKLIIEEGCGNDLKIDLSLSGFDNMESLIVKRDSLRFLKSLIISNNDKLKTIQTEKGNTWDEENKSYHSAFENVQKVEITNLPKLEKIIIGGCSFYHSTILSLTNLPSLSSFIVDYYSFENLTSLSLTDLPKLEEFSTGESAFLNTTSLTLSHLHQLSTFIAGKWSFKETKTVILSDLPNLCTFTAGCSSFAYTERLTLSKIPFKYGDYTCGGGYAFDLLQPLCVYSDYMSSYLKKTILTCLKKN